VLLIVKGYRILARRYSGNGGEIDLIARRGDTVVFVEVKARADLDSAAWSISPTKQRRFARAAHHWQARNSWASNWTLRCDAVLIARSRLPRHVVDAFTLPA
jgi:putative endonuclease